MPIAVVLGSQPCFMFPPSSRNKTISGMICSYLFICSAQLGTCSTYIDFDSIRWRFHHRKCLKKTESTCTMFGKLQTWTPQIAWFKDFIFRVSKQPLWWTHFETNTDVSGVSPKTMFRIQILKIGGLGKGYPMGISWWKSLNPTGMFSENCGTQHFLVTHWLGKAKLLWSPDGSVLWAPLWTTMCSWDSTLLSF